MRPQCRGYLCRPINYYIATLNLGSTVRLSQSTDYFFNKPNFEHFLSPHQPWVAKPESTATGEGKAKNVVKELFLSSSGGGRKQGDSDLHRQKTTCSAFHNDCNGCKLVGYCQYCQDSGQCVTMESTEPAKVRFPTELQRAVPMRLWREPSAGAGHVQEMAWMT